MAADEELTALLERMNLNQSCSILQLKTKQKEALLYSRESDVLVVLPTGYGKTIIIQGLPFLHATMENCVLVVNPLNAIIEEQKIRFGKRCIIIDEGLIRDLETGDRENLDVQRLRSGNVNYILGHPEHILHPSVKELLMSEQLSAKLSHIIVDEAHCILSWGKSEFRPAYMKLGVLRTIIPNAKVLALTATAAENAQLEIKEALFMQDAKVVLESPDRANVFLEVLSRPPSTGATNTVEDAYNDVVDPILKQLQQDGRSFDKTIIYLPLKWCGHVHHRAVTGFLKDHPNNETTQSATSDELTCLISQYHAPQTSGMKSLITKAMQDINGNLRLLLATEAYGMGADAPDVRHIVHVGPPSSIERYIQEIGRCGRDGKAAQASLFFNNSDISSNVSHLNDKMREYCKLESCRRSFLLTYFGFQMPENIDLHDCCDNCKRRCTCDTCSVTVSCSNECGEVTSRPRSEKAYAMLTSYFAEENKLCTTAAVASAKTGLSEQLAETLSKDPYKYADMAHIKRSFPLLAVSYCTNISFIIAAANLQE